MKDSSVWSGLRNDTRAHSLNGEIKLELAQPDRVEAAWKRTLLGYPYAGKTAWGSKAQVQKLCSVSPSLIGFMRKVVTRYREDSAGGALFRKRSAN
jgi:hypothetical protein